MHKKLYYCKFKSDDVFQNQKKKIKLKFYFLIWYPRQQETGDLEVRRIGPTPTWLSAQLLLGSAESQVGVDWA